MKTADAIEHFESSARVAGALGISRTAVSLWGEDVPLGRAYQLQVLTGGVLQAVSKEEKIQAAKEASEAA